MINIRSDVSSLRLSNPTMLASGILDEDTGSMARIFNSGAGAVVTKSIGVKPKIGYKNPTFVETEFGVLNAMGLPNPGIEEFGNEIKSLKKINVPVIGSIFGSDLNEFVFLSEKMQDYGVDALELNLSCPHAKGYGIEIGSDRKIVEEITESVKNISDVPVFVKLSSNLTDIVDIAKAAENGNADGIVAINSVKAMEIDLDLRLPILSNNIGGYSGKAIKPIGIRCVYEISEHVDIPIIGVGGITNGFDAIEYIMAGATAVQIGAGIYYRGIEIFKDICSEIKIWMKEQNIKNISELIGVAHI